MSSQLSLIDLSKILDEEFLKPKNLMWSSDELYDFCSLLKDDFHLYIVCRCLEHPAISPRLLKRVFEAWPNEMQMFWTFIIEKRISYSDELLKYIVSFDSANVWTMLFSQISEKKISFDQIKILWEKDEFYYKHRLIMHMLYYDETLEIPEYMWVEYYIYINNEQYRDKYFPHNKSIIERLGGRENLCLAFVRYINRYSNYTPGIEFLPFEWLLELAETNITITGK